jgi:hypothetical protein
MQSRILGNPEAKPLDCGSRAAAFSGNTNNKRRQHSWRNPRRPCGRFYLPHSVHQSQDIQSSFAGGATHPWLLSCAASRLASKYCVSRQKPAAYYRLPTDMLFTSPAVAVRSFSVNSCLTLFMASAQWTSIASIVNSEFWKLTGRQDSASLSPISLDHDPVRQAITHSPCLGVPR